MKKVILFVIFLCSLLLAQSPKLYSKDGAYLGNVNKNQYNPNSISNPYGEYGSKFSSKSVPYTASSSPIVVNKLEVDNNGKLIKMKYEFTSALGMGLLDSDELEEYQINKRSY